MSDRLDGDDVGIVMVFIHSPLCFRSPGSSSHLSLPCRQWDPPTRYRWSPRRCLSVRYWRTLTTTCRTGQ